VCNLPHKDHTRCYDSPVKTCAFDTNVSEQVQYSDMTLERQATLDLLLLHPKPSKKWTIKSMSAQAMSKCWDKIIH